MEVNHFKPARKENAVFLMLSLVLTVNSVHRELSFKGNGFQVYHIAAAKEYGESNELKLWFRTKQPTGMLTMIQNGGGSLALVGMYDGKLRYVFKSG